MLSRKHPSHTSDRMNEPVLVAKQRGRTDNHSVGEVGAKGLFSFGTGPKYDGGGGGRGESGGDVNEALHAGLGACLCNRERTGHMDVMSRKIPAKSSCHPLRRRLPCLAVLRNQIDDCVAVAHG